MFRIICRLDKFSKKEVFLHSLLLYRFIWFCKVTEIAFPFKGLRLQSCHCIHNPFHFSTHFEGSAAVVINNNGKGNEMIVL